MMPLSLAQVGEENIIKRIGGSPEVKRHLENLGFVVGGEVTVVNTLGGNVIVNVKEAKILAGISFLLPSSVLKINGSIFVWLSSAKMVDTPQIINMLPKINPN